MKKRTLLLIAGLIVMLAVLAADFIPHLPCYSLKTILHLSLTKKK